MRKHKGEVKLSLANLLSILGLAGVAFATTISFSSRLTAMESQQVEDELINKAVVAQGKSLVVIQNDVQWIKQYLERRDK